MSTSTGSRRRYASEYRSWSNMKSRAKDSGTAIAPEFVRFEDFIQAMGPKPSPEHTLDRIDPFDPIYGPENCRWASKEQQANNRRNTIKVMFNGEMTPIAEVARATGQNPDTLRRRISQGWPDEEVVYGRAALAGHERPSIDLMEGFRWLGRDEVVRTWASLFLYGEKDEFGTHSLTLRIAEADGSFRDETFAEFVVRINDWLLDAFAGGDLGRLPHGFQMKLASISPAEQAEEIAKVEAQYALALEKVRDEIWSSDPLSSGVACDVPWLEWLATNEASRNDLFQAVREFQSRGLSIPEPLRKVYVDKRSGMMLPNL